MPPAGRAGSQLGWVRWPTKMPSTQPKPSSPAVSRRMSRLGRRDTAPERAIRSELHRRGLRFRVDREVLAGSRTRPDLVFVTARVVVFIDGCFWHGCPEHRSWPKSNADWWREKLEGNVRRDRLTDTALTDVGWLVIRIWEHESPCPAAERIERAVRLRK